MREPELELARVLAGTRRARERERAAINELASGVDWDRFAALLVRQRLMVLLGRRLTRLMEEPPPREFLDRLRTHEATARHRATLLCGLQERVLAGLAGAGISAMPLKGVALSQDLYGDPALRTCTDVDVLVHRGRLDGAVRALHALGWSEPQPCEPFPRLHRVLTHRDGRFPAVEVHWRVHWYETTFARALLDSARCHGGRAAAPLELAALLLFYARDGFVGLRYAADLTAWWDARGGELAPLALARVGNAHPELAPALAAAVDAAHRVAGFPSSVADGLPGTRRGLVAARAANWRRNGSADQIAADFTLVDWLLAPPGGHRAFVKRHLLPPQSSRWRQLRHGRGVTSSLAPRWVRGLLRATQPAVPPGGTP